MKPHKWSLVIAMPCSKISYMYCRAQNEGLSQGISDPFQYMAEPSPVGQIYWTFSMGGSLTIGKNVTISNRWPTNFKYLFWALILSRPGDDFWWVKLVWILQNHKGLSTKFYLTLHSYVWPACENWPSECKKSSILFVFALS